MRPPGSYGEEVGTLGTSRRASMSALGVSGRRRRARPNGVLVRIALVLALSACGLLLAGASWGSTNGARGKRESVIVRVSPGSESKARLAVARLGGTTGRRLAIIDGFVAEVPASGLGTLRGLAVVRSVTANSAVRSLAADYTGLDPESDLGDRKSTRLNTSHRRVSRMASWA